MPPNPFTILQKLAAFQNLTVASDVRDVVSRLQEPLFHYAELEFRSDGKRIDLITLSNDRKAVATFLSILQERGTTDQELATCKALLRFGAGKVVGMKLPIARPIAGGELYIRGALPLVEVSYFLERHGVNQEAVERMGNLARVFDKEHTHMLATNAAFPSNLTVFFTTYLVPGATIDQLRLQQALQEIGIADEGIAAFLHRHRLLGANRPKTLYFSWNIVNGEPTIEAKIDYADVRLGLVCEATAAVGATAQADIPIEWGTQLGLRKANYAGVVVNATGPAAIRAYFTRRLPDWP